MDKDEQQFELVARAFVDLYYQLFDANRAALSSLYNQPTCSQLVTNTRYFFSVSENLIRILVRT